MGFCAARKHSVVASSKYYILLKDHLFVWLFVSPSKYAQTRACDRALCAFFRRVDTEGRCAFLIESWVPALCPLVPWCWDFRMNLTGVAHKGVFHKNLAKNHGKPDTVLERNSLTAHQIAQVNSTQKGDWEIFASSPWGV
jgi:hypothetical protein